MKPVNVPLSGSQPNLTSVYATECDSQKGGSGAFTIANCNRYGEDKDPYNLFAAFFFSYSEFHLSAVCSLVLA
jgi:hypothetical protein